MKIRFSDNDKHLNFCPLTLTRPVCELRFGITTIKETWANLFKQKNIIIDSYYQTESYLQEQYNNNDQIDFTIAGNIKPSQTLLNHLLNLDNNTDLFIDGQWVVTRGEKGVNKKNITIKNSIWINEVWELFQKNKEAIALDYQILTENKKSQPISSTNQVINSSQIFIESGAKIECAILNATDGPIYIGKNAEIMEGSMIRGGFALGKHSTVKMGAKIYGATSIGPECKVGGEISNCIIQGYSNKGHDGFIGNSIIGEWCNLGADTNSSNLKNNYGTLKIYNFKTQSLAQTNNLFCGVLMGDHSKTGINTMLNTATTIGVSSNVFGSEFPPKYIPSFSWGTTDQFNFDKAIEVAQNMMKRRGIELSKPAHGVLKYLFNQS